MSTESLHPLRRWRKANGLTQKELGAEVGTKKSAIAKYEAGAIPKRDVLQKLTALTGIQANDFYEWPPPAGQEARP